MKIGFYSPYLHILGGGERYILTMASLLSKTHDVTVFGDTIIKRKMEQFFGLNLERINFSTWIKSKYKRILMTREFDRFFYVTDGSLFTSLAKKNFLIIQVPQKNMYNWNLATQIKLYSWPNVLVYSEYVKNYIDQWWRTKAIVLPPGIDTGQFSVGKKENIILSVGRFFPLPHSKKQEVLIKSFKEMCDKGLRGWKLILAGGVDKQGKEYLHHIQKIAKGLPIEIFPNIDRTKLLKIYKSAKIYWHAAGFGEDLNVNPERAEHFGITTVEAMDAGCVPFVYPAGGQKEIVRQDIDGMYWDSMDNLVEETIKLINNPFKLNELAQKAKNRARLYDIKNFSLRLNQLLS